MFKDKKDDNFKDKKEKPVKDYEVSYGLDGKELEFSYPPNFSFGLLPDTEEEQDRHTSLFPIEKLGWEAPTTVEVRLTVPTKETSGGITTDLIEYYNQGGSGMCVGYSGTWATTVRNSTPELIKKYNPSVLYCKCRELLGDYGCNKMGGATMSSVGKALRDFGHCLVIGKTTQSWDKNEGIESYYWGSTAQDARLAISQGKPAHFGINWYQAFMSPKLINGEYWIGWQTGSWGAAVGGHAIVMIEWSDSRNAGKFKNSWGYDYPEVWIGADAINRVLQGSGELMICIDRSPLPPPASGKVELVEPFTITPTQPANGDKITAHLKIKNTGTAKLTGISLAIEDMLDNVGGAGFGFTDPFDLDVGQGYEHTPVREAPLTAGLWRFRGDYKAGGVYYTLGTVSVAVSPDPLPPPPPVPVDSITTDITIKIGADSYSAKNVVLSK